MSLTKFGRIYQLSHLGFLCAGWYELIAKKKVFLDYLRNVRQTTVPRIAKALNLLSIAV